MQTPNLQEIDEIIGHVVGPQGETGATPNITIGTVSTLEPGQSATATMTGTPETPVLNLGIPKGQKGDPGEATKAELDAKAPVICESVSGSVASFEDGADGMPIKSLTVNIEPVQEGSGDPSPENVRPITGWTGCNVTRTGMNIWNEGWERGAYNQTTGAKQFSDNAIRSKDYIPVCSNTTYFACSPAVMRIYTYDASKSFLGSFTNQNDKFTTGANVHYITFNLGGVKTYGNNISVNYPSTDHDYHAYVGRVYPITFPDSAGIVYGGTLTINDDGTGEIRANPYYDSYNGEALVGPWVSSMDVYVQGTTPTIGAQVVDLGGVETVYQLTAQQVLETLYSTNNIWADCGPVSVDYPADTKLYIQKINAPTDDDMTADTQIASGKYFLIGNTLYLSTTIIPAGDTIIPGTNCQKTDLAAALNALNA